MSETKTYHEQVQIDQTLRLRELLKTLPPFPRISSGPSSPDPPYGQE